MAKPNVSARAARRNILRATAHVSFFLFNELLMQVQLALRLEHALLYRTNNDPQIDMAIRDAEQVWLRVRATATTLLRQRPSSDNWVMQQAATLILALEGARDHTNSDAIYRNLIRQARELSEGADHTPRLQQMLRTTEDVIAHWHRLDASTDVPCPDVTPSPRHISARA